MSDKQNASGLMLLDLPWPKPKCCKRLEHVLDKKLDDETFEKYVNAVHALQAPASLKGILPDTKGFLRVLD